MGIVLNSEPMAMNCSLIVFHAVPSDKPGNLSARERFSKRDCALISRYSSSISS